MKTFLAIMTFCLALLAGGALTLLIWQHHQTGQLTAANAHLLQELEQSHQTVTALNAEKTGISEKLATLETLEKQLRDRVDSLETAAKTAAETVPRPYRVRAFLGQESVGEAWIVPHNVRRDPETGRYTFEPVLLIDESARNHFTVHHTNVVEREVYTTQVYQEGYGYPYVYYVPSGRHGKPGRPSGKPQHPGEPAGSTPQMVPQPSARAQLFAPPMSIVNSRPQVLGVPATSPMNAQMFAP